MGQSTFFNKNSFEGLSYADSTAFLDETLKNGIKPGHKRIKSLLAEIGNPQQKYKTILVTGTNGKTSTANFISAILTSLNYKTGLYVSPHLYGYCERIKIDGCQITEADFSETLFEIKEAVKTVNNKLKDDLTNFEIITAMAFYFFAKQNIDCAVLEVGMGARFDATCLTGATVSVVTNVELDHTDYLGSSIKKIAKEKAFVIKDNSKVVIGCLKDEALKVIEKRVKDTGSSLYKYGRDFDGQSFKRGQIFSQLIDVSGVFSRYTDVKLKMVGRYQSINVALAVTAVELFKGGKLNIFQTRKALSLLALPGRTEIIATNPLVVIDGAHNPAGASNLKKFLINDIEFNDLILILAIYKDKDYKGIIHELGLLAKEIIFSENSNQRSIKAEKLLKVAKGDGLKSCKAVNSLKEAIDIGLKKAKTDDLVCITGSLGTVADARVILKD